MTRRGTYSQGFAPRDYEPAYPSLWRGCVGAWCPSLGPTGATLLDWSGFAHHGALTNFTLSSAWATNQGQYAIVPDGSNDWVIAPPIDLGTSGFTLAGWFFEETFVASCRMTDGQTAVVGPQFNWIDTFGGTQRLFIQNTSASGSDVIPIGRWVPLAITWAGNVATFFIDGITDSGGPKALAASPSFASTNVRLFAQNNSGSPNSPFGGAADDIRIYNRALNQNEIKLLSLRRGIAYEPVQKRCASSGGAILVPYYHLFGASA